MYSQKLTKYTGFPEYLDRLCNDFSSSRPETRESYMQIESGISRSRNVSNSCCLLLTI